MYALQDQLSYLSLHDSPLYCLSTSGDKIMKVPQSPHAAASVTNSGIAYSSQTRVKSPVSQEDGDSDQH